MLQDWARDTGILVVKMLAIVLLIMTTLEVSRSMGWMDRVIAAFRPVARVFGLGEQTTTMFVAGTVFGLLYGGAVIVEEASRFGPGPGLRKADIEYLHISLGINHSMIEDPALFAALGLSPFWLWVPRLVMAIAVVQVLRGIRHIGSILV
jgi:hypothetical protein